MNFKQNDTKALRSKSLLNEIESVYDEVRERETRGGIGASEGAQTATLSPSCFQHQEQHSEGRGAVNEPHLVFVYEDKQILDDAASLIGYYVKRQPAIQKEDQATIRQIIYRFVPELFFSQLPDQAVPEELPNEEKGSEKPPPPPSLDVRDLRKRPVPSPAEDKAPALEVHELRRRNTHGPLPGPTEEKPPTLEGHELRKRNPPVPVPSPTKDKGGLETAVPPPGSHRSLEDVYTLFLANNNWYFFLRLHQTLCSRLLKIYRQAQKQLLEYRTEKEREKLLCEGRKERSNDPAMELRLKQPSKFSGRQGALCQPGMGT